jgi:hypothetical protein
MIVLKVETLQTYFDACAQAIGTNLHINGISPVF